MTNKIRILELVILFVLIFCGTGINEANAKTIGVTDLTTGVDKNNNSGEKSADVLAKKRKPTRNINITNFLVKEYYQSKDNYYTFKNGMVKIYYNNDDGTRINLYDGQLNSDGAIKKVNLSNVPKEINNIKIVYTLGNSQLGYIQKSQNDNYSFTYTKLINDKATDIDGETFVRFHQSNNQNSYYCDFIATKIFNFYQGVYNNQVESVEYARSLLGNLPEMSFEPINIVWEMGYDLDKSNGFYRDGHLNSGTPDIVIADRKDVTNTYLRANLSHEWAHWNMYRAIGMLGGSYNTDYTYNSDPHVSYKEGWAEFNNIRYIYGYNWLLLNSLLNQTDYRLYGKSTNMTAASVIYDLFYDDFYNSLLQEDNNFHIAGYFNFSSGLAQNQRNKLADGLLYISMVDSKATTLSQLLQYVQQHFILTMPDQDSFVNILKINGLNMQGNFTLDQNGNSTN